ncbi:ABC-type transport auxiliary lipoprotein family protein [Chelatococcus reniformis]|uniref:ABC-type transport auxiliary lipoprotein family protein n=1 Tax=Chelatococcus reniformis TaxID=1494448 RepID=UPI001FCF109D|nr:ABC-type transport auxiliary lipoprotein family protein [Chelatococcus reniformis]
MGEPAAVQVLNGDRVIVKDGSAISFVGGAQWADRLPALIQTRLIETFENGSRLSVGRANSSLNAQYLLSSELRAFQIEAARGTALVEITARLLTTSGQVLAARVFKAEVPVAGAINGASATRALNDALQQVLVEIVRWASS